MDYDLVTGTSNKELYLYLQCPYGRNWHPDQRGASGGGDVQKVRSRLSKRWKNVQKVDTLGFPTVQTDWKNSTVAPSYPPGTSGNLVLKFFFLPFFGPTSDP